MEDILRSLGAVLDTQMARAIEIRQRADGARRPRPGGRRHRGAARRCLVATGARRHPRGPGPGAASPRPRVDRAGHVAGPHERCLRAMGRLIDRRGLRDVTLIQHPSDAAWLLWHRRERRGEPDARHPHQRRAAGRCRAIPSREPAPLGDAGGQPGASPRPEEPAHGWSRRRAGPRAARGDPYPAGHGHAGARRCHRRGLMRRWRWRARHKGRHVGVDGSMIRCARLRRSCRTIRPPNGSAAAAAVAMCPAVSTRSPDRRRELRLRLYVYLARADGNREPLTLSRCATTRPVGLAAP